VQYYYKLGQVLRFQSKWNEAEAEFRKAVTLQPNFPWAYHDLGLALREQGRFSDAVVALKHGQELLPDSRLFQSTRETERLAQLDAILPVILKGEAQPTDPEVGVNLAFLCLMYKHRDAAAADFYAKAFVAEPKLADDVAAYHRYNAACAAVLAGCGRGGDAPAAEADRARLRSRAMQWLRDDLNVWRPRVSSVLPGVGPHAVNALTLWREDHDLADVRDPNALMKLPEAERQEWQKLWADLDALLPKTKP